MTVLTQQQRNTLETAVKQARRVSEAGALNALRAMAVDNPEPFVHMSPVQRSLRNRLRSKARLLGDELPSSGHQKIDNLVYELAYEYWHKMLFTKFLEANGLMIHPEENVPVTMAECEELALEGGYADKWDIAASFASKMLPAIFRPEDPLMQIAFAPDDRIKLEEILEGLDNYIFTADDALGWVYQFWQSEAKEIANKEIKKGAKVDGKKLPAVTQLFTESYMVHFLIDNTIGAWWVSRNPRIKPPINFEYLRLLVDGTPAAGKFEGWPDKTAEVITLDPCMGSGHFVVSLFAVLVNLRMQEEGLSKEEATDRVISENIHGLEIDPRCTQIAAFNLALTAWKFCGKYKELPEMNLACSGIAPKGKKEDWIKLVGKVDREDDKARMENGMAMLYDHFQLAPELGSLLDPTTIKADLHTASFNQLQPVLKRAMENETDKDLVERGVMAAGIARAGQLLAKRYTLQITNVPYLARGKQGEVLADYCENNFKVSKKDIATVFFEKLSNNLSNGSSVAVVIPQSWMFQPTYRKFRELLLREINFNVISLLGNGAFSQISGEVVKPALIVISKNKIKSAFIYFDISDYTGILNKEIELKTGKFITENQVNFLNNPESKILISSNNSYKFLANYAESGLFIKTGDDGHRKRYIWEINNLNSDWKYYQTTVERDIEYGGRTFLIDWRTKGEGFLAVSVKKSHGIYGIGVSQMSSLSVTLFTGEFNDSNICPILPKKPEYLIPIWCFCVSSKYKEALKEIDKSLKITNATLVKVPFDLEYWQKVGAVKYPNGLPDPYSDDPTQWIFHGHPIKSNHSLQVALSRLLGYRWPAESDTEMELSDETRQLIEEVTKYDHLSDNDGVICIPSVNKEETAANRLRDFLKEVFEEDWNTNAIQQLLEKENTKTSNLESWFRNEFFIQHCKVFHNRPFIWHIWDGRNDGFSALVNYHKLTRESLSKLIYTYLGDWIRMCEAKRKAGESGAEGLLSAAVKLKEKLELILEGEAPYDIFVRWKPLEQQPIGWDPDLNDGVRLNIRPFILADVLRKKPNIKWGIDRGKNPPGSLWGEIRDNDRHLTLAEKKAAREKL